ncbi:MAG: T9SS type A sorting domain-containing protein [Bacteroidetes bacterium]|nr:T9SS type A sorting domain-containing protein [Bacteroidota bacterium]
MKLNFFILCLCIAPFCAAQNWTKPLNISNMEGLNNQPDITVDQNGTFHCVWAHKIVQNFWKIYYSQSSDEGLTWSVPDDISLNTEKWVSDPHIVCDSENNLYLTYDYDVGNYLESLVYYKKFDGISWSDPIVVSEGMPESHANKLVIDNNDRVYCFWYRSINNGTTFYRYLQNGFWSDYYIPYNNNDYFAFINCAVDSCNNLHWIGAHHYEGQTAYDIKPVYLYYDYENDLWSDIVEFGEHYSWYGFDIDLDTNYLPHLVWQEFTNDSIPPNDGTFYAYNNGTSWTTPELIVEDPRNQQIIIDTYNNPNIFDTEKSDDGQKIIFYYFLDNFWNGYIIDETPNAFFNLKAIKYNNKIFLFYSKSLMADEGQIFYSKMDMITNNIEITTSFNKFKLFPNPFTIKLTIVFEMKSNKDFQLKIYTIQGKLINTLINENKSSDEHEITWDGKDQNGKEVTPGLYLIRLQSGRNILTRSVILVQ